MVRRLVVLCDGTFNDPGDRTNVFQLKNALARPDQLLYYDEGVGVTEAGARKGLLGRTVDAIAGGAFGSGLSGNVQQAYRWVCDNFQDGDELYFFGFSRGAFTARSTVGMIRKIGLVRAPLDTRTLKEAFNRYRDEHHPKCQKTVRFRAELNTRTVEQCVSLRFLGVWDTVGALGLPVVGPRSLIARRRWAFHDLKLSSQVKVARQALALDEKRTPFLPAPWLAEDPPRPVEEVEQRWFSGCHSDIGGRHGRLALHWLANEAQSHGLVFDRRLAQPGDPQVLHESLSWYYRLGMGAVTRPVHELSYIGDGTRFMNEVVDPSAAHLVRFQHGQLEEVPDGERSNVGIQQRFRGPRLRWGLFASFYLSQYEALDAPIERCCGEGPETAPVQTPGELQQAPPEQGATS